MSMFQEQIDKARQGVKALKRATPWIFPEWQRLAQAKSALEKARIELEAAKKAWREL